MEVQVKSIERVKEHAEVFTARREVEAMLDLVADDIKQVDTKVLEPACGNGNFLVAILERKLKDFVSEHSMSNTDLEKIVSSIYGIDILEDNIKHTKERMLQMIGSYCSADFSKINSILNANVVQADSLTGVENIFPEVNFDIIVGNPPYQIKDGGYGASAKPLYHLFVQQAKELNPKYIVMIIPSKWFAGGKGLNNFRKEMLHDRHIRIIVDYTRAKDCFPDIDLSGGVNYFLWDRDNTGDCKFTNIHNGIKSTCIRRLDEFPLFIRYNKALPIVRKVINGSNKFMSAYVSSRNPFCISSYERGIPEKFDSSLKLYHSKGFGYIPASRANSTLINTYRVMIGKATSEHAGQPSRDGDFKVITQMQIMHPKEVCTDSYLAIGSFQNLETANNCLKYLKTKFARFLLLLALSSIHLSKDKFMFVPAQDFTKEWSDYELYKKYNLDKEEIDFIETIIKPM